MQQDFTVFWRNNTRAYELFEDLRERADRGAYDDDYLSVLGDYQEEAPDTPNFYIFAARYLLAYGVYDEAARLGERAFRLRSVNCEVWKLLAEAYQAQGRTRDAAIMQCYASSLYDSPPFQVDLNDTNAADLLRRISIALDHHNYAPHVRNRAHIKNNQIAFSYDIFLGEELPLTMPEGSPRFWVGTYVDEGFLCTLSSICYKFRQDELLMTNDRSIIFDLQKAHTTTGAYRIEVPEGTTVLLPVAGTDTQQDFSIQTTAQVHPGYLGPFAFNYFRLSESAELRSDGHTPYAVGTPIVLGHSPRRKKLVLNILVDGFCWPAARPLFAQHMPQIAKFFSRGLIFNQHFSASEFTFPSLVTLETGLYAHHTQIFNEECSHELPLDIKTLSERMKALGYHCTAAMASGQGIYHGTMRGYDRLITGYGLLTVNEGAERTIRQIEAFNEADLFLFFHTTDIHPLNIKLPPKFSEEVETRIPLADHFVDLTTPTPSVRIPHLPIYLAQHAVSMRHVDRSIGQLLAYIENHYDEDEYIVSLYSDHGCGLFEKNPPGNTVDWTGPYATGAVWMMRGAGVPEGVVADELTSTADIYPALGTLCGFPVSPEIDGNLPAALGGKERDVVYSCSMFPGDPYKLAVRSKTHALRLETRDVVDEDGTVDFADARVGIYPRGYEWKEGYEEDSEDLRAFFYPRAREFVRPIANNGECWPSMRKARPQWFGEK